MADEHVDSETKESKNVQSIFTLFSDITGEKNENPSHCLSLIKTLRGNQFSVGSASNLDYSVKRLVRGLGSTRLHSQCGCFAALTCILKYHACLVQTVLETLRKEQKPAQGATKSEVRALNASCVLTCGAIIHSGLFCEEPREVQEDILKRLIDAGKKKNYLLTVICQFLIDVINLVDDEQYKNLVWPICKSELLENLEECGPDLYNLLLSCWKKNSKATNKFLQKNATSPDFLIEKILKCLFSNSVKSYHQIYDNLGQFFCTNATSPIKFWTKCVNENTKINSHKDAVLITIFFYIIKNLQEPTIIPKLLVPKFLETIITVLSFKKTRKPTDECSSIAKDALKSIVTLLSAEGTSDETRLQTIKKLLFYPCNLKFEMKTGTKCISSLVPHLSSESTKKLVDIYRQIISGEVKKKIDNDGTEECWNSKEKQHALHVLSKTLNHPSLKKEINWKLDGIKFIFEVGFLKKSQMASDIQKCAKDCFYKTIMVQMPSLKELILFLNELALYVNENIKSKELKTTDEVEGLWDKMFFVVEILKKKSSNKLFTAVHILLIYMGLHLFIDWELAKGGIEELLSCYENLKETQKKKTGDENTPHWTEVTVDLILSLLSRENRLWRHVVSCVFPQIVAQLTPTALQQIIDALDPKSQNGILSHINSDDSEEESKDYSEDSEGSSESSLSAGEGSDLDEDEGKPNDQLRMAVRNALGYSAAQTDDESVDMDQMDEEEEKRLNESLSEAFRQFKSKNSGKKKKQTKEEEALTHFRLRVLDLTEIYITNSPPMGGCLDLLLPLFDLFEFSIKDHNQRPLQTRLDSIIRHLSVVKSFSSTEDVNQDILKDVFKSVIARKDTPALVFDEMSPRISDSTAFLVRCSQLIPNESSDIPLVDEYQSLLKGFCHSRDFKLPISAFQAVLRIFWRGNFQMAKTLFDLLVSPEVRIFKKMKIIELLRIFYKNEKLHSSCDKALKSELNEMETNFINNFIDLLQTYKKNETKSSEKIYLSFFSNVIVLINVIQSSSNRHRSDCKRIPPWRNLVEQMTEVEFLMNNKKTRSQLGNLAHIFNVELPVSEKFGRKRKLSEVSNELKEESEGDTEEKGKKKKKRKMSAEKQKLKRESRKLREEISSDGLSGVNFSAFGSVSLPEPEVEDKGENEEEEEEELKTQRYANEVGEAFRSLVHQHWVTASYGVASAYVLADTVDKTIKMDKVEKAKPVYRSSRVIAEATKTVVWQSLASVIIPGFIINRLCALTSYSLTKFTKLPTPTRKWTTTAVGLGSIPFIVKPIDTFVDLLMENVQKMFFND